jgi:hypothetical protein
LHAAEHLVLDLDQVAGIEKLFLTKERIFDALRMGIQGAVSF